MRYTADFRYDEAGNDGEWHDVVEDFKSLATMTEAATLRLALFQAHPGKLKIVGRGIAARGTGDGETERAMSSRRNPARPANNVVTEMSSELRRQQQAGGLTDIGMIDQQGRVWISGTVDLAMLAHVTEYALRREFAAPLYAQAAK
jgi:hypothetical protein